MRNASIVILKSDGNYTWIAVRDPASGKRGRYTVYRGPHAEVLPIVGYWTTARFCAGRSQGHHEVHAAAKDFVPSAWRPIKEDAR